MAADEKPARRSWLEPLVGATVALFVLILGFLLDRLAIKSFLAAIALTLIAGTVASAMAIFLTRAAILPGLALQAKDAKNEAYNLQLAIQATAAEGSRALESLLAQVQSLVEDFDRRLELLRGDLAIRDSAIISDAQLAVTERSGKWSEVLIVTDELLVQFGGTKDPLFDWIEIMSFNLARGISYTYIIPDRVHIQNRSAVIRQHFNEYIEDRLRFVILSELSWSQLPVSLGEYIIYNSSENQGAVFYSLPLARGRRHRQWVEVGDDFKDYWVGGVLHAMRQGLGDHGGIWPPAK